MDSVKGQSAEGKPETVRRGTHLRDGQSYGIDDPLTIAGFAVAGGIVIAAGFLGALAEFRVPSVPSVLSFSFLLLGFIIGFLLLLFAFSLYWSSRSWKPMEIERLSSTLPWGGDELVLDIGCGRGLFSIIVADEIPSGGVVAVDLWRKRDLSGNDPKSVGRNAEARGTRSRIFLVNADPRFLPFANGVFNAAVSGLALNHVRGAEGKASSLHEMIRVLKGGGRLALLVSGAGVDTVRVLKKEAVRDLKASSFRLGLFPPAHSVVARKPFTHGK